MAPEQSMRYLFTPPPPGNGVHAETTWMLYWAVFTILGATVATNLIMTALDPQSIGRYATETLEIAAVCAIAIALARRGHVIAGGRWMVGAICVFLMVAAWTSGGLDSTEVAGYLVAVSLAALILGVRAGIATTVIALLAYGILAYAQFAGLLPAVDPAQTAFGRALNMANLTLILATIGALTLGALNRSRASAESDLAARIAAEEEIRQLNASLEARVRERTSALKSAVTDLERINQELDVATQAKAEFMASMNHELRTPLNSIIGFSGILESGKAGPLSDEQERQIHMIGASGQRLLGLVNQVLDLSKLESSGLEPAFQEIDVSKIAVHSLAVLSPIALAKGLDLRSDMPSSPVIIVSDPARLDQVLLNLVGNAVKFTDEGTVLLRVRSVASDVVIEVEDTGPGISEDELPRVFDRFYQVPPAAGGKHEGTGLGLSVTRQLVESLGGSVDAESRLGSGSVFRVTLPKALLS